MGFTVIEGMKPLDAFFLTIITLSTVGFGLLQPLSEVGKLFTIGLVVAGVAVFSSHVSRPFSRIVEKGFLEARGHRRFGYAVAGQLRKRRIPEGTRR